MESLIIEIPCLPDPLLSPNRSRVAHWGQVTSARNQWKHDVFFSAFHAKPEGWRPPEKARINITFVYPFRRRRDQTNLIAMWKSGEDMLVAAGVLVDDDLVHLETMVPRVEIDKARSPLTIVSIERLEVYNGQK